MRSVVLDFETRSDLDINDVGAYRYATDPSTDIICLSYSLSGAEPKTWAPGLPFPADLREAVGASGRGEFVFEAHNYSFERLIWWHVGAEHYGFPVIRDEQWRCTMAACAYRAIALKLEKAGEMLETRQQKDKAGNLAMKRLSSGKGWKKPEDHFAGRQRTLDYCAQDVRTEAEISGRVGWLPLDEEKVWKLDRVINDRGVQIDTDLCAAAVAIGEIVSQRLVEEHRDLTGGLNPTQRDKLLEWAKEAGHNGLHNLQAETVETWLSFLPAGKLRRVLEIRQAISKSSAGKYATALGCVGGDGRARGLLQYHGATTGRWAGRLIQPQNFPRGNEDIDIDDLVDLIKARDPDFLDMVYPGGTMQALADATRGMIVAGPGRSLAVADFSAIEAVVTAALAGEARKLDVFWRREDPYCTTAGWIFGRPISKKENPAERQVGKICELAFGFAGGVGAWRKFDSSDRYTDEEVDAYKTQWREAHPNIAALWKGLEGAAIGAVLDKRPQDYRGIRYELAEGDWLTCTLLSGRRLWYYRPELEMTETPWGSEQLQLSCLVYKMGQIQRVRCWCGHLTENVVQATARDLMVAAMFRAEAAGLPVILTVHDELVTEPELIPTGTGGRLEAVTETLRRCMETRPLWAHDWPVFSTADEWQRYRK